MKFKFQIAKLHLLNSLLFVNTLSLALQPNNDVMPQQYQHNNILYFEVPEGAPNNTWIGTIKSADGQPPYLVVPLPQTPENELKAALNINFKTGDLTTNGVLDREHRDQYQFITIVREPFAEIKCYVNVKDVNDNAPIFLMPSQNDTNFVIDVPEGQSNIRRVLPLAIDLDSPQFGIKEFRIVSGNIPSGMFQLVEHEAPARSTLIQGGPSDDSVLLGTDNPQLMQQLAQQANVLIPSQPSSSSKSINPSSTSKFLIDLEVMQPLDRENQSTYQFVVEAIDGGQPPGRLLVTVNVQDVNDNDPVFSRKFYECHFREDTPKGTLIYRVQASDVDLDLNGQVSYHIKRTASTTNTYNNTIISKQRTQASPQTIKQLFDIDPNKGEIYLVNSLDFETDQFHELLIEARDHGKPSRSGFTTVKVYVIDVNDDPVPSAMNRIIDPRPSGASGEFDVVAPQSLTFNTINFTNLFTQMSSSVMFAIILLGILAVSFSVCLLKIKSRRPESDYNDTAGLTIQSSNEQSKSSPSHSTNNLEHPGTLEIVHHRHHDHQRRPNPPSGKMSQHQYLSDNFYHDSPPRTLFPWPPTQDGCFASLDPPDPGSTMDSTTAQQPLDRWFDLGVSSQLVYSYDLYSSYNWDYLNDWTPEYHNLMPHILEKSCY